MKNRQRLIFLLLVSFLSAQSYAFKPFTVTCGDGKKIDIADSKYSPSGIANACLAAGHKPPLPSTANTQDKISTPQEKMIKKNKTFRASELKRAIARNTGGNSADVDHSDIILMLQGCHCISPSCVAYSCPVDVDIP